jgi:signal transduction histidine kinase
MSNLDHRVALALRLARLGLDRLAEQTLKRACDEAPERVDLHRHLAEMALNRGDGARAAELVDRTLKRADDPASLLVAADAALAAGDLPLAAQRFGAARDLSGGEPNLYLRALVGSARAAYLMGEPDDARRWLSAALAEHPIDDGLARLIGDLGGILPDWRKLQESIEALRRQRPDDSYPHYLLARLLAAAQARYSPGIPNAEIERLLRLALEREPGFHAARLMLALRLARRRYLSDAARDQSLSTLRFLSQALRMDSDALDVDAGLIDLLIAALLDETPGTAAQAVDFYLAGLRRLPGHSVASNNLGVWYLARGETSAARRWFLAALAASPHYDPAYLNLVQTLDLAASPEQIAREVDGLVATLGAPSTVVTGRIVAAMAEDARNQVFEALHAKGSQLHNLLGVVTARLKSALGPASADGLWARLDELASRLDELRLEWGQYLRSMQEADESPTEVLNLNLLVREVARDESGHEAQRIDFDAAPALPDIKGQRASLYEALVAIVRNGLEAQPPASPPLVLRTRPWSPLTTRVVLEVRDYGPGITAGHRAQLFVPGFSTKRERSGFGLSLARRIVSAHRGWIELAPAPERGTIVRVVLPTDLHGLPALLDQRHGYPYVVPLEQ